MGDPKPEKRRKDENQRLERRPRPGEWWLHKAGSYRWQSCKCFPHTTARTVGGVSGGWELHTHSLTWRPEPAWLDVSCLRALGRPCGTGDRGATWPVLLLPLKFKWMCLRVDPFTHQPRKPWGRNVFQVCACLRSREHWFLPRVVVEAANLIRQSIKDSVCMGIDHWVGFMRWYSLFWDDQTTIGRMTCPPEATLRGGQICEAELDRLEGREQRHRVESWRWSVKGLPCSCVTSGKWFSFSVH